MILAARKEEKPSHYAERLGIEYSATTSQSHKKEIGQFFTPLAIGELMSSFSKKTDESIKILDPGIGTGILSCSLIEHLIESSNLKKIELVAYEIDGGITPYTNKILRYLKRWLSSLQIQLTYRLIVKDFIIDSLNNLNKISKNGESFDFVISNPPYFKLSKDDHRAKVLSQNFKPQTNIYSAFVIVSASLLKQNGQLIFIVPRSFTSGNYFKLFRDQFFSLMQLDHVHLFVSRKDPFTKDNVLQEMLILKATRNNKLTTNNYITISSSHGMYDIKSYSRKKFAQRDIVDLTSKEKILHLPINEYEERIMKIFQSWNGNLNKYDIQVSTGPVVAFRTKEFIYNKYENSTVFLAPLFWLHNIEKMKLIWPVDKPNKGQYIRILPQTKSVLLANKDYILLRRFSTKDDKSRLIAAPLFSRNIATDYIGIENKLNYIYRPNGSLSKAEVMGLCALLNCDLFDNYFGIFNGNVNVSATELREMSFPPLEDIKAIGEQIILSKNYSMDYINRLVNDYFQFTLIHKENE